MKNFLILSIKYQIKIISTIGRLSIYENFNTNKFIKFYIIVTYNIYREDIDNIDWSIMVVDIVMSDSIESINEEKACKLHSASFLIIYLIIR